MEAWEHEEDIETKPVRAIYRTVDIHIKNEELQGFSLLKLIWGTDIWINNVPVLKCLVTANILVWILLFVFGR